MAIKRPRRYNPMRVVVEKIKTEDIPVDPDFGTPIGNIKREERREFQAQVNIFSGNYKRYMSSVTGDEEKTDGKIIIRKYDYDQFDFVLEKGDRLVEFGPEETPTEIDAIIHEVKPTSPLRGDFLLIEATFKENRDQHSL